MTTAKRKVGIQFRENWPKSPTLQTKEDPRTKAILKAYKDGASSNKILRDFNIGRQYFSVLLKTNNVKPRVMITMKQKIYDLLLTGDYSSKIITAKLNLKGITVRSNLPYMGFNRRLCECGDGYIYTLKK